MKKIFHKSFRIVFKKGIAVFVCAAFMVTSVYLPQAKAELSPVQPSAVSYRSLQADMKTIALPEEIGRVQEIYRGTDDKVVILIQDAHSIPDAQRSIRSILDFFQTQYGISLVGLEGASNRLEPQIFRSFPDKELLRKTLDAYTERGELTGGTAAAIFGANDERDPRQNSGSNTTGAAKSSQFFGIEDWPLYEEGVSCFLKATAMEGEIKMLLDPMAAALKREKENVYSKELLELDNQLTSFSENKTDFVQVLKQLSKYQPPPKGSEVEVLLREIKIEPESITKDRSRETSDQRLSCEIKDIAGKVEMFLKQQQPSKEVRRELQKFNGKFQEFQTSRMRPQAFALYLKGLVHSYQIKIRVSLELAGLVENQRRLRDIEGTRLFEEFKRYAGSVTDKMIGDAPPGTRDSIMRLNSKTKGLELIKRLVRLELSFEDWNKLQKMMLQLDQWTVTQDSVVSREEVSAILRKMESHLAFYKVAEQRDEVFLKNISSLMRKNLPRAQDGGLRTATVVAGGFHTGGLTQAFKEHGISYILIAPKIASMPEEPLYRQHMQGQVSWSNYFEVKDGKVNLYDAFVRATRDQLLHRSESKEPSASKSPMPHALSPMRAKEWRNQIIRDLSAEGRITQASEYTRFIDELSPNSELQTQNSREKWLANIDRFGEGLKKLLAGGKLNESGIRQLLKTITLPAPAVGACVLDGSSVEYRLLGLAAGTPVVSRQEARIRSESRIQPSSIEDIQEVAGIPREKIEIEGFFRFVLEDLIGDYESISRLGAELPDGWDQGQLDEIRQQLRAGKSVSKYAWLLRLNALLRVKMPDKHYAAIKSAFEQNPSGWEDIKGTQNLLDRALSRDQALSEMEIEHLNRRIMEAFFQGRIRKSQGMDDTRKAIMKTLTRTNAVTVSLKNIFGPEVNPDSISSVHVSYFTSSRQKNYFKVTVRYREMNVFQTAEFLIYAPGRSQEELGEESFFREISSLSNDVPRFGGFFAAQVESGLPTRPIQRVPLIFGVFDSPTRGMEENAWVGSGKIEKDGFYSAIIDAIGWEKGEALIRAAFPQEKSAQNFLMDKLRYRHLPTLAPTRSEAQNVETTVRPETLPHGSASGPETARSDMRRESGDLNIVPFLKPARVFQAAYQKESEQLGLTLENVRLGLTVNQITYIAGSQGGDAREAMKFYEYQTNRGIYLVGIEQSRGVVSLALKLNVPNHTSQQDRYYVSIEDPELRSEILRKLTQARAQITVENGVNLYLPHVLTREDAAALEKRIRDNVFLRELLFNFQEGQSSLGLAGVFLISSASKLSDHYGQMHMKPSFQIAERSVVRQGAHDRTLQSGSLSKIIQMMHGMAHVEFARYEMFYEEKLNAIKEVFEKTHGGVAGGDDALREMVAKYVGIPPGKAKRQNAMYDELFAMAFDSFIQPRFDNHGNAYIRVSNYPLRVGDVMLFVTLGLIPDWMSPGNIFKSDVIDELAPVTIDYYGTLYKRMMASEPQTVLEAVSLIKQSSPAEVLKRLTDLITRSETRGHTTPPLRGEKLEAIAKRAPFSISAHAEGRMKVKAVEEFVVDAKDYEVMIFPFTGDLDTSRQGGSEKSFVGAVASSFPELTHIYLIDKGFEPGKVSEKSVQIQQTLAKELKRSVTVHVISDDYYNFIFPQHHKGQRVFIDKYPGDKYGDVRRRFSYLQSILEKNTKTGDLLLSIPPAGQSLPFAGVRTVSIPGYGYFPQAEIFLLTEDLRRGIGDFNAPTQAEALKDILENAHVKTFDEAKSFFRDWDSRRKQFLDGWYQNRGVDEATAKWLKSGAYNLPILALSGSERGHRGIRVLFNDDGSDLTGTEDSKGNMSFTVRSESSVTPGAKDALQGRSEAGGENGFKTEDIRLAKGVHWPGDEAKLTGVMLGKEDIDILLDPRAFDQAVDLVTNGPDQSHLISYAVDPRYDGKRREVKFIDIWLSRDPQKPETLQLGHDDPQNRFLRSDAVTLWGDLETARKRLVPILTFKRDRWFGMLDEWAKGRGFTEIVMDPLPGVKSSEDVPPFLSGKGYVYDPARELYVKSLRSELRGQEPVLMEIPGSDIEPHLKSLFEWTESNRAELFVVGSVVRNVVLRQLFKGEPILREFLEGLDFGDIDFGMATHVWTDSVIYENFDKLESLKFWKKNQNVDQDQIRGVFRGKPALSLSGLWMQKTPGRDFYTIRFLGDPDDGRRAIESLKTRRIALVNAKDTFDTLKSGEIQKPFFYADRLQSLLPQWAVFKMSGLFTFDSEVEELIGFLGKGALETQPALQDRTRLLDLLVEKMRSVHKSVSDKDVALRTLKNALRSAGLNEVSDRLFNLTNVRSEVRVPEVEPTTQRQGETREDRIRAFVETLTLDSIAEAVVGRLKVLFHVAGDNAENNSTPGAKRKETLPASFLDLKNPSKPKERVESLDLDALASAVLWAAGMSEEALIVESEAKKTFINGSWPRWIDKMRQRTQKPFDVKDFMAKAVMLRGLVETKKLNSAFFEDLKQDSPEAIKTVVDSVRDRVYRKIPGLRDYKPNVAKSVNTRKAPAPKAVTFDWDSFLAELEAVGKGEDIPDSVRALYSQDADSFREKIAGALEKGSKFRAEGATRLQEAFKLWGICRVATGLEFPAGERDGIRKAVLEFFLRTPPGKYFGANKISRGNQTAEGKFILTELGSLALEVFMELIGRQVITANVTEGRYKEKIPAGDQEELIKAIFKSPKMGHEILTNLNRTNLSGTPGDADVVGMRRSIGAGLAALADDRIQEYLEADNKDGYLKQLRGSARSEARIAPERREKLIAKIIGDEIFRKYLKETVYQEVPGQGTPAPILTPEQITAWNQMGQGKNQTSIGKELKRTRKAVSSLLDRALDAAAFYEENDYRFLGQPLKMEDPVGRLWKWLGSDHRRVVGDLAARFASIQELKAKIDQGPVLVSFIGDARLRLIRAALARATAEIQEDPYRKIILGNRMELNLTDSEFKGYFSGKYKYKHHNVWVFLIAEFFYGQPLIQTSGLGELKWYPLQVFDREVAVGVVESETKLEGMDYRVIADIKAHKITLIPRSEMRNTEPTGGSGRENEDASRRPAGNTTPVAVGDFGEKIVTNTFTPAYLKEQYLLFKPMDPALPNYGQEFSAWKLDLQNAISLDFDIATERISERAAGVLRDQGERDVELAQAFLQTRLNVMIVPAVENAIDSYLTMIRDDRSAVKPLKIEIYFQAVPSGAVIRIVGNGMPYDASMPAQTVYKKAAPDQLGGLGKGLAVARETAASLGESMEIHLLNRGGEIQGSVFEIHVDSKGLNQFFQELYRSEVRGGNKTSVFLMARTLALVAVLALPFAAQSAQRSAHRVRKESSTVQRASPKVVKKAPVAAVKISKEEALKIQGKLVQLGLLDVKDQIGVVGPKTRAAIGKLQRAAMEAGMKTKNGHQIEADGKWGPETERSADELILLKAKQTGKSRSVVAGSKSQDSNDATVLPSITLYIVKSAKAREGLTESEQKVVRSLGLSNHLRAYRSLNDGYDRYGFLIWPEDRKADLIRMGLVIRIMEGAGKLAQETQLDVDSFRMSVKVTESGKWILNKNQKDGPAATDEMVEPRSAIDAILYAKSLKKNANIQRVLWEGLSPDQTKLFKKLSNQGDNNPSNRADMKALLQNTDFQNRVIMLYLFQRLESNHLPLPSAKNIEQGSGTYHIAWAPGIFEYSRTLAMFLYGSRAYDLLDKISHGEVVSENDTRAFRQSDDLSTRIESICTNMRRAYARQRQGDTTGFVNNEMGRAANKLVELKSYSRKNYDSIPNLKLFIGSIEREFDARMRRLEAGLSLQDKWADLPSKEIVKKNAQEMLLFGMPPRSVSLGVIVGGPRSEARENGRAESKVLSAEQAQDLGTRTEQTIERSGGKANVLERDLAQSRRISEALLGVKNLKPSEFPLGRIIRGNSLGDLLRRYFTILKSNVKHINAWVIGNVHKLLSFFSEIINVNRDDYDPARFFDEYGAYLFGPIMLAIPVLTVGEVQGELLSAQLGVRPGTFSDRSANLALGGPSASELHLRVNTQAYAFRHTDNLSSTKARAEARGIREIAGLLWSDKIYGLDGKKLVDGKGLRIGDAITEVRTPDQPGRRESIVFRSMKAGGTEDIKNEIYKIENEKNAGREIVNLLRLQERGVREDVSQVVKVGLLADRRVWMRLRGIRSGMHASVGHLLKAGIRGPAIFDVWFKAGNILEKVHKLAGLSHCDIKPPNILFNLEREAFLTDFGSAVPFGENAAGVTPGFYVPGEEKKVTEKFDVFGFVMMIADTISREILQDPGSLDQLDFWDKKLSEYLDIIFSSHPVKPNPEEDESRISFSVRGIADAYRVESDTAYKGLRRFVSRSPAERMSLTEVIQKLGADRAEFEGLIASSASTPAPARSEAYKGKVNVEEPLRNSRGQSFDEIWKLFTAIERDPLPYEDPRTWKVSDPDYAKKLKSMNLEGLGNELLEFAKKNYGGQVIEEKDYLGESDPENRFRQFVEYLSDPGSDYINLHHHLSLPRMPMLREIAEEKPQSGYGNKLDQYEMFLREVSLLWSAGKSSESSKSVRSEARSRGQKDFSRQDELYIETPGGLSVNDLVGITPQGANQRQFLQDLLHQEASLNSKIPQSRSELRLASNRTLGAIAVALRPAGKEARAAELTDEQAREVIGYVKIDLPGFVALLRKAVIELIAKEEAVRLESSAKGAAESHRSHAREQKVAGALPLVGGQGSTSDQRRATVLVTKEMLIFVTEMFLAALKASGIEGKFTIGFDVAKMDKNLLEALRVMSVGIGTAVIPSKLARDLDLTGLNLRIQRIRGFGDYNPAIAAENSHGVPVLADTGSEYFSTRPSLFGVGVETGNVDGGPFLDVAEDLVRIAVGLKKADLVTKGLKPEEIKTELIAFLLKMGLSEGVVTFDPNGRHLIVNRSALLQQIVREYQATAEVLNAA